MPLPQIRPVIPQPQPQPGLPIAFQTPFVRAANGHVNIRGPLPTLSNLNVNVTSAVVQPGSCDSAGRIVFSTNAVIAAATQLFIVAFAMSWQGTPVVLVGGGTADVTAYIAGNTTTGLFGVFCVGAVANAANQVLQWIAVGNDPIPGV